MRGCKHFGLVSSAISVSYVLLLYINIHGTVYFKGLEFKRFKTRRSSYYKKTVIFVIIKEGSPKRAQAVTSRQLYAY